MGWSKLYYRVLLTALGAVLCLSACGNLGTRQPGATYHTVQAGETLFAIAWRHGRDYRQVAAWNGIAAPYAIYPGQRVRVSPFTSGASVERIDISRPRTSAPSTARVEALAAGNTSVRSISSIPWQWPTAGSLKWSFHQPGSKQGIAIAGRLGQPVYAAAAGDVVYSGSGLVGYGNLLIIKHDDNFLSAYGHNQKLLVWEGARVKSGQPIAQMGDSGRDGALLHFEIRHDGRPIDPLLYLPRRP